MPEQKPSNAEIADSLDRIAELLEVQDANPHRVRAYREGARTLRSAGESAAQMVREGDKDRLEDLPGIGPALRGVITELVQTGRSNLLERLKGEVTPEKVFTQVPGIGEELAQRIVDELGIQTLEELEDAAHDGRLQKVEGFGERRVEGVRESLAGMLSQAAQRRARQRTGDSGQTKERPDVGTLLDVDAEYRQRAEAGDLKTIAPKRFNSEGEAWLPILHSEKNGWDFTALYSNTARAHDLDKTHDWVVIYYERDGEERQVTVVTETRGPLEGKRVVRGWEAESRRYYSAREEQQ